MMSNKSEAKLELLEQGKEIVTNAPQLFIDVDIEADGIAGHGSMLSLGAVTPSGDTFYREISPMSASYIPDNRKFCEEHGLNNDRLRQVAPDYEEVMGEFGAWVKDVAQKVGKKPVMAAFNASFDWAFVDLYFLRARVGENPFGIAPLDLKSLAILLTGEWDWSATSKSKLPELIIPDGEFTHHALEDAQYQQQIHFGLAALLGMKKYLQGCK